MFHSDDIKNLLSQEFALAQAKNSRYSMRSFAKRIGIPQSSLSEIMAGKRSLTRKTAEKILIGLKVPPHEISQALRNAEDKFENVFTKIDADSYSLIADWYNYAILSLAETESFQSSPAWISERLGVPETKIVRAIQRLKRLGLLQMDEAGEITVTGQQFQVEPGVANKALRKSHFQNLKLADKALKELPFETRDFSSMTVCLDPDRLKEAQKLVRNFYREFGRIMGSSSKKEVYKLNVQLFPLTVKDV